MSYYNLPEKEIFLVSQKAVILDEDKLLVLHRAGGERADKPKWGLPGGLLEMHESLNNGLVREVKEETGLIVEVGKLFVIWDHWEKDFKLKDGRVCDVRIIELAYTCTRILGKERLSKEHDDYLWARKHELGKLDFSADSRIAVDRYLKSNSDLRPRCHQMG